MANTKSAKKATRVSARRTEINKNRVSRMRTFVRKVEEAIASGNQAEAAAALQAAQPELMRGAQKGVLHKNTASRKVSRLAARLKSFDPAQQEHYSAARRTVSVRRFSFWARPFRLFHSRHICPGTERLAQNYHH